VLYQKLTHLSAPSFRLVIHAYKKKVVSGHKFLCRFALFSFFPNALPTILSRCRTRSIKKKNPPGVRRIEEDAFLSSSVQNFPQEAWLLLGPTDCWMQSDDGRFQAPGTILVGRWFVWDCLGREGLCLGSSRECRMHLYGMVPYLDTYSTSTVLEYKSPWR